MNKILVLSSGGIDSTSLLYAAVKLVGKENVIALCMYYGQKHKIEIDCAKWQAEHLGVRFIQKDISVVFAGLENSSAKILPADKTVLFTSRAGIGKTAILRHEGATNQGFQSMVLNDEINPYFVFSMSSIIKDKAERVASDRKSVV